MSKGRSSSAPKIFHQNFGSVPTDSPKDWPKGLDQNPNGIPKSSLLLHLFNELQKTKRKGMKRCEGESSETMFDVACHISNEETPMVS